MIHANEEVHLYILGAGGHGRELHAYLEDLKRAGWKGRLRGHLDDSLAPGNHRGLEVLGPIAGTVDGSDSACYITAVGSNPLRKMIVERLDAARFLPWTLVHPLTYLGEDVEIGDGSCVAPGAIVTAKVQIGCHCIVNVKASISHDCVVGDFANINPAATLCGAVAVGEGAFVGAGAVVKEKISIGAWSVIGAGAVVIHDIPPHVTAVGVPARIVSHA